MGLPRTDPEGRIYANPLGVPAFYSNGVAYDTSGRMCTTTTLDPLDTYNAGWRLSNTGQVVVAPIDTPVFNNGMPFNQGATPGAMAVQTDQVPAASDPYQDEVRIGPNGVHLTSAIPP